MCNSFSGTLHFKNYLSKYYFDCQTFCHRPLGVSLPRLSGRRCHLLGKYCLGNFSSMLRIRLHSLWNSPVMELFSITRWAQLSDMYGMLASMWPLGPWAANFHRLMSTNELLGPVYFHEKLFDQPISTRSSVVTLMLLLERISTIV